MEQELDANHKIIETVYEYDEMIENTLKRIKKDTQFK